VEDHVCVADAVIWAERQLVAIPGWLLKYQNARLDQERKLASIKEPRLLILGRTRQKEELFTAREGEQDGDPSHPPPPPSGDFGARTPEFSEKPADLWKKW
jgi:hypothetical protein